MAQEQEGRSSHCDNTSQIWAQEQKTLLGAPTTKEGLCRQDIVCSAVQGYEPPKWGQMVGVKLAGKEEAGDLADVVVKLVEMVIVVVEMVVVVEVRE